MKTAIGGRSKFITAAGSLIFFGLVFAGCKSVEQTAAVSVGPPEDSSAVVEVLGGKAAAELRAEPDIIESGESVSLRVVNHGELGLSYGRPVTVERWEKTEWVETDESRGMMWTMELLHVAPGETGVEQTWPFLAEQSPEPGWYRLTKHVQVENPAGESVPLTVRARVRVGP